ncbi:MAG: hypothetical protein IT198_01350 [Acidimicrobiia bacterium]|nr:hypothetical protein [Acidimicrobiia bacterium]
MRRPTKRTGGGVVAAVLAAALTVGTAGLARPATAAVDIVVTTNRDVVADDGLVSLREAVDRANRQAGPETIVLAEGDLYRLTRCGGLHEDVNVTGDLDFADVELTIRGTGATIMQTCAGQRVLHALGRGSRLGLFEVVIDSGNVGRNPGDGEARSYGGGVRSAGSVLVRNSRFERNLSPTNGGALWADGRVEVLDSLVVGNVAGGKGAGFAALGDVSVLHSSIIDGVARGDGGGIWAKGNVYVKDSTLANNSAGGSGGAIRGAGVATQVFVDISTLTGNSGGRTGGGVTAPSVSISHATVVDNAAPAGANVRTDSLAAVRSVIALARGGVDCALGGNGAAVSSGWNFSGDASCGLRHATDQQGGDPRLGALAANGGSTETHLPLVGSPLLDRVPVGKVECGSPLFSDQRGAARPRGGGCDIGAVEL